MGRMKAVNFFALCMMIALISFLGFVVENLWLLVSKGYMDNRNMVFPFLIGYGLAVIAIYLLFGTPEKICILKKVIGIENRTVSCGIYFLIVMVCISIGEIVLGTVVEKTCHFYWWDYSDLPFHITRYTSIPTSAAFTTIIVFFMGKLFMPIYNWFLLWDKTILAVVSIGLMTIMVVDYVYSAYYMYTKKKMQRRWRREIPDNWFYRKLRMKSFLGIFYDEKVIKHRTKKGKRKWEN